MTEEEQKTYLKKWEALKDWMVSEGICDGTGRIRDGGRERMKERGVYWFPGWCSIFDTGESIREGGGVYRIWVPDNPGKSARWHFVRPFYYSVFSEYPEATADDLDRLGDAVGYDNGWATAAALLDDDMDTL
jgi:hypothetical protein